MALITTIIVTCCEILGSDFGMATFSCLYGFKLFILDELDSTGNEIVEGFSKLLKEESAENDRVYYSAIVAFLKRKGIDFGDVGLSLETRADGQTAWIRSEKEVKLDH